MPGICECDKFNVDVDDDGVISLHLFLLFFFPAQKASSEKEGFKCSKLLPVVILSWSALSSICFKYSEYVVIFGGDVLDAGTWSSSSNVSKSSPEIKSLYCSTINIAAVT